MTRALTILNWMKVTYYKTDSGYIAVTDEHPPKFKGVLLVGRGPDESEAIAERVFPVQDLSKLKAVPADQVPEDWLLALGYEQPAPEREVIDITWWPFSGAPGPFSGHSVPWSNGDWLAYNVGAAITMVAALIYIFLG